MKIVKPSCSEIREYQRWEREAAQKLNKTRYIEYTPDKPVFQVQPDDVPVQAEDLIYTPDADGRLSITFRCVVNRNNIQHINLPPEFSQAAVTSVLASINGSQTVEQIIHAINTDFDEKSIKAILNFLAGSVILLPATINNLEERIAFNQIVRIPVRSPYSISRQYWDNQGSIRQYIREYTGTLNSVGEFKTYLSDLHIIATLGQNRKNYYGGGGGIATTPGVYRAFPIETRVSAAIVDFIHAEIAAMGFNYPTRLDKTLKSNLDLVVGYNIERGQLHHHHYDGTNDLDRKLDEMRAALVDASFASGAGRIDAMIDALAYFHWMFTHVHPYTNINNSIAMNIVNNYLISAGIGYIPHLFLDYFAQRTGSDLYRAIFIDAIRKFSFPANHKECKSMIRVKNYYQAYQRIVGSMQ